MIIELFSLSIWPSKNVWAIGILAFAAGGWTSDRHLFYLGYHADDDEIWCWHFDLFWIQLGGGEESWLYRECKWLRQDDWKIIESGGRSRYVKTNTYGIGIIMIWLVAILSAALILVGLWGG